jgi:hypothetical protein
MSAVTHCPICGKRYGFVDRFSNSAMCPSCFNAKYKADVVGPLKEETSAPDATWGRIVAVLCAIGGTIVLILPARAGSSPGGKFYLFGLALAGVAWGLRQVADAKGKK